MAIRHPTEHQEQAAYFQWLQLQHSAAYDLAAAVPNGAYKSKAAAGRFKAEGLKAGYPDILIDMPRGPYHGLRIEMKRRRKSLSATSDEQHRWGLKLREQGFYWTICYGAEEAMSVTNEYMALGPFDRS